jgi:hypothetical protein
VDLVPDYRERLRAPLAWWLIGGLCVLILGSELFAGYSLAVGAVIYVVLALVCGATLLHWSRPVVSVSGGELRAGAVRLPLAAAGQVRPLDQAQTRALRGPRANPAAYVLTRPYLKESVYVEVTSAGADWPYLLLCTRHPDGLAEAIERSKAALARQD